MSKATHPVDIYIGRRLRLRRKYLGLSQDSLAKAVGISFQQLQKYERATNRIAAGRLYDFAKILGVSPGWFFRGYGDYNSENQGVTDRSVSLQ